MFFRSLVTLSFPQLFCLINTFLQDFLANSKKKSYLCARETISNDISDKSSTEGVSKCPHPLFYAQSPDFLKPGLCYFLKFLYL